MAKKHYTILEKDTLKAVLQYLKLHRVFCWRSNSGASVREYKGKRHYIRYGTLGAPDIFALSNGKVWGIEVKGSEGEQSQHQVEFQVEFEAAGGKYVLARSIEDLPMDLWWRKRP